MRASNKRIKSKCHSFRFSRTAVHRQPSFCEVTWNLEPWPIVDKQIGPWYFAVNPPREKSLHRLSDTDFDDLFARNKPVIFAFHGYPWLIHRLTYRRANHDNIHVRGYKEEGTITTAFDMTVLNDLDRFHLVMDAIARLPQTGEKGVYLKQQLQDKLIEHKQYINQNGEDLPEIRNWKWPAPAQPTRG